MRHIINLLDMARCEGIPTKFIGTKHLTTDFRTYPYSSYQTIYQQKNSRIPHNQIIEWFGNPQLFATLHQQFDDFKIQHLIEDDYE
ncbi:hypothetical protein [Candidatus Albibeggiatoa sp. nov. BB20]|uniref:hypothetical protein n=1 Tax=Candidatus Albibeggiatoa sp. nov. BB20 TaxID=3162723 RepID=UPI0033657A97